MTVLDTITNETSAKTYVNALGDSVAVERIERFVAMLLAENERQNLISRASANHLWQRHIADSAQLVQIVSRETLALDHGPWMDLGSGPGLPGLIVAILRSEWAVVLIEARARRVEFLDRCVAELDLLNCRIIGKRVETVKPFDAHVISARAFAPLDKLLSVSSPFSTGRTIYVLPKGRSAMQELEQQTHQVRQMFHVKHSRTDANAGILVGGPGYMGS